jgi:hypothetical protein
MPTTETKSFDLPEWVYLTPGPIGTLYTAVIGGVRSKPYSTATDAIMWGLEQIERQVIQVTEDVATAAWGPRVVATLHRGGRAA